MVPTQTPVLYATDADAAASVVVRRASVEDAAVCGRYCYEAFKSIAERHGFPPDFPGPELATDLMSHLFSRTDLYAVVAELDGQVVGSNVLWEQAVIAGVGPITVDPAIQDRAVGSRLMREVMQRANDRRFAGIRLVQAAYHNRSLALYSKLGFDAREPLSTMQGPPMGIAVIGYDVRPACADDLVACNQLCRSVHGHDRASELHEAIERGTARIVECAGRITGYCTSISFFGHAVTQSNEGLMALIGAAEAFPDPGFLLPTRNSELLRWCIGNGLRIVQPMTLMTAGLYNEPRGAYLPSIIY